MPIATFQDGVSPSGAYDVPDGAIQADLPTTVVGTVASMTLNSDVGGDIRRLVFSWDISSIPAGATINSAMLKLRKTTNSGTPKDVEFHRLGTAVVEATTSWDVPVAGGDIQLTPTAIVAACPTGTDAAGVITDFADIAALAQDAIDNRSGLLHFLMKHTDAFEAGNTGVLTVRSSNDATTTTRPILEIDYTEAASGGGGGSGRDGRVARGGRSDRPDF